MYRADYIRQLSAVERAARGSHWQRLAFAPIRYCSGMAYSKLAYPFTQKSILRQAPTFFGFPMAVLLPAGLDIYLLGAKTHDSEIRLARYIIRHITEGQTALDIGAHFGYYTLLCAHLVGHKGRVLAVEAAEATFNTLQQNTRRQEQVEVIRAAASDENGRLTFYEFPPLFSEYNTLKGSQYKEAGWKKGIQPRAVEVPAYRMDSLLLEKALMPDFIKIDVEGAEANVLSGLSQWLENKAGQSLSMEYHSAPPTNEAHRAAAQFLASKGWMPFSIQTGGQLSPCPDIDAYLSEKNLESDNIIFRPTAL